MRVIGLDLSLTSTGMSDGLERRVVRTSPADGVYEARLDRIECELRRFLVGRNRPAPGLVVMEGPSFRSKGPGHEELAGVRAVVRRRLWRDGIPFAIVPPRSLKAYVTGNGNASKAEMVSELDRRYMTGFSGILVKDGRYDMADAFGLAAMGYERVGLPLSCRFLTEPVAQSHAGILAKIEWPDLISD